MPVSPGPVPEPPPPLLHLPYETGAFRMALGLQAAPDAEWLEIDGHYHAHLSERRRLIAACRPEVIAALPDTAAMQGELLTELVAHLAQHYPQWFALEGEVLLNRLTGEQHAWPGTDPLGLAGQLVQEDFCLLRQEEEGLRLMAAVLCFPSRWRLSEKLGKLLGAVHKPVPFYADKLARPVDRFLSLLKTGKQAVRLNWSVMDDAALFQPAGHGRADPSHAITPQNAGTALVLRVERQTFRRLPASGTIVFGIRVHVTPLREVTQHAGEAARLREAVLALPPEMERYKSILPFRPALLGFLDGRIAADAEVHG
jgi:hypothetical protein